MFLIRRFLNAVSPVLTITGLVFPLWAAAQSADHNYPSKTVRFICPFPPGGATDFVSRFIAQRMTESWGQQVFVDNRGGASGIIGTELGARAPADGYTITLANFNTAANSFLYSKVPYDVLRDFAPVIGIAESANVLLVHPSVPANSLKELVELAKAKPGSLNFGSPGSGTFGHLAAELINTMAGIKLVHVPYKGSGPAIPALLAGEVQVYIEPVVTSIAHVRSGKLRAIAVTSGSRVAVAPEVPTMIESGLSGYDVTSWYGVLVPAATPRAIVSRLNAVIDGILKQADVKERLTSQAMPPTGGSPEAFGNKIRSEMLRWSKVVKDTGAKAD